MQVLSVRIPGIRHLFCTVLAICWTLAPAAASIIHWPAANVTVNASNPPPFYYISLITGDVTQTPLSGDGIFLFGDGDVFSNPSAGFLSVESSIIATQGEIPADGGFFSPAAARFDASEIIDGSVASRWTHSFAVLMNNYAVAPDWSGSTTQTGYIGISFTISGDTHYAWASVSRSDTNFTLLDFAYESDADTGIAAGAVPEAQTRVLVAIGSLLCFLRLWRSRGNRLTCQVKRKLRFPES